MWTRDPIYRVVPRVVGVPVLALFFALAGTVQAGEPPLAGSPDGFAAGSSTAYQEASRPAGASDGNPPGQAATYGRGGYGAWGYGYPSARSYGYPPYGQGGYGAAAPRAYAPPPAYAPPRAGGYPGYGYQGYGRPAYGGSGYARQPVPVQAYGLPQGSEQTTDAGELEGPASTPRLNSAGDNASGQGQRPVIEGSAFRQRQHRSSRPEVESSRPESTVLTQEPVLFRHHPVLHGEPGQLETASPEAGEAYQESASAATVSSEGQPQEIAPVEEFWSPAASHRREAAASSTYRREPTESSVEQDPGWWTQAQTKWEQWTGDAESDQTPAADGDEGLWDRLLAKLSAWFGSDEDGASVSSQAEEDASPGMLDQAIAWVQGLFSDDQAPAATPENHDDSGSDGRKEEDKEGFLDRALAKIRALAGS